MNYTVHLTRKSGNVKTGPIPVSMTEAQTCPNSCPFKKSGCYASYGPLAMHWRKVSAGTFGMTWAAFCVEIAKLAVGTFWRHNQAGDLPGHGEKIDAAALALLVSANKGKRGFTYTHKYGTKANQNAIKNANENGFTINLSANNLSHADKLAKLKIAPVVVVVPHDVTQNMVTPEGRKVVICPATQRENVSCDTCRLCSAGQRSCIVAFPGHGSGKYKIDAVVKN